MIRGRLLKVADQEHVLLVTMHHIVSDGWSIGILIRELSTLYAAYREGRANPLPALKIQYADYAQWQRRWLQGEVLQGQLSYWKKHLEGAPQLLQLPTDRERPLVQGHRGGSVGFRLGAALSRQLKELSQQHSTTLFMTLYAGFAVLLSKLSHQQDIVIGTAIANRQRTELEGLIGFFVNTLALRARVDEQQSVIELLSQVKETTLGAYAHQGAPFEQVVEALQPVRSLSHSPVFQVMLVLQNVPHGELQLPGLRLSPQGLSRNVAQFDLTLWLQEVGDEIAGVLDYASDLFEESTVQRWAGYLQRVYEQMGRDAHQELNVISVLDESEREQLLRGFNATEVAYPQESLIHELFEAQVRRTPNAIAVVDEQEELTYAELNGKANQLARYLRAQGVVARAHGWRADLQGEGLLGEGSPGWGRRGGIARRGVASRGIGSVGGDLPGARCRDGGGTAGHPQGRRSLRADGSQLSARALATHARGCRTTGGAHTSQSAGSPAGERGADDMSGQRLA